MHRFSCKQLLEIGGNPVHIFVVHGNIQCSLEASLVYIYMVTKLNDNYTRLESVKCDGTELLFYNLQARGVLLHNTKHEHISPAE